MIAEVPLAFAFSAGLLATLNPCGFAMLPAYLSYFIGLGDDETADRGVVASVGAALTVGGLVSLGFLIVFGVAGLLLAVGVGAVVPVIPWLALAVGVGVIGLGGWLLSGRTLPVPSFGSSRAGEGRGLGSALSFGVSFAVASMSCTLPVFLTVVATATAQPSLTGRLVTVGAYGAGMTLLLLAVTVLLALGRAGLVSRLRALTPVINRVAGAVLVAAGVYVIAYWAVVLSDGEAAPVDVAERIASVLANVVAANPGWWGAGLAAIVVAAVAVTWSARRGRTVRSAPEKTAR